MSDGGATAPAWYPDPSGRHELRWHDGTDWTEHVSDQGRTGTDPPTGERYVPTVGRSADAVTRDVSRAGVDPATARPGGGTIFTEPVLVVSQKAKLIELSNEYAIFDARGTKIGAVRQVGQSTAKKVLRALTSVDQFLTHKLQVVDPDGQPLLALTRPAKVFKSRLTVEDGAGAPVGEIVQENMIGKIHFGLHAGGARIGSVDGENWRAWNFAIRDATGTEVARITKTWEGLAKTLFTTADNYVVQLHRPLEDPLRSLVVAAALGVDTALKQDARGLG